MFDELEQTRLKAKAAEKSKEEIQAILDANKAPNILQFDEATTRKLLIDQLLVQAGWNVGANGKALIKLNKNFSQIPTQCDGKRFCGLCFYGTLNMIFQLL
ncbi:MAG: hypothetical protein H7A34_01785 [bacterium]|nr:hypothetical protein [bacterium]